MSDHNNSIYSKSVVFTLIVTVVILIGSVVTAFVPVAMDGMHPKIEALKPYTALQLAGRDIYQKEGCINCHSQVVRPLKADVLRYGEYSKAGENYYERPFLWGSKRTGPDLARIGGKYSDQWHIEHFVNPQAVYPASNMPKYDWLPSQPVDVEQTKAGMDILGFPYTQAEIDELKTKNNLDALTAYMQVLGTFVEKKSYVSIPEDYAEKENPNKSKAGAAEKGRLLYEANCAFCHGMNGEGHKDIVDRTMAEIAESAPEGQMFVTIANGTEGMPEHINIMQKDDIWNIVTYLGTLAEKLQDNSN